MNPAFAFRHDVHMADDAEHFLALAVVDAARVAVEVFGFEAEASAEFERVLESAFDGEAERRAFAGGFRFNARETDALLHGADNIVLFAVDECFNGSVHIVAPFLFYRFGIPPIFRFLPEKAETSSA